MNAIDYHQLAAEIRIWARELGFGAVGIAGVELAADEAHLVNWLESGYHGEMDYMARHGTKRSRPRDRRAHGLRAAGYGERVGHARR
jgi:epoxyqueuosine reductase